MSRKILARVFFKGHKVRLIGKECGSGKGWGGGRLTMLKHYIEFKALKALIEERKKKLKKLIKMATF